MKASIFRWSPGLGAVIALLGAGSAQAARWTGAPSSASACAVPALTQPFLSFGDPNWYAIAPGESYDNFSGSGWTLAGGARIVATKLSDWTTGDVLDLPHGATATSPAMCVTNDYTSARTMVREVTGSVGVSMSVAYGSSASDFDSVGTVKASGMQWSLSPVVSITPVGSPGWQFAWYVFVATGATGEDQLYNFYVDPRMSS